MPHRAESILEAVRTNLTGLATTGSRVERGRIWPVEECPAISIEKGNDQAQEEGRSLGFQDRELQFTVTAYVKSKLTNPETDLNQIAAEVYTALFADVTQGLAYVIDTHWLADAQPELSGDSDSRTAIMRMNYAIQYRHSLSNPEN